MRKNPLVIIALVLVAGAVVLALIGYLASTATVTEDELENISAGLPPLATSTPDYSAGEIDKIMAESKINLSAQFTEADRQEAVSAIDASSSAIFVRPTRWQSFMSKFRRDL